MLERFYSLFQSGFLAWGFNIDNPNPPHFHVTKRGKRSLQERSRAPENPAGYLAAIDAHVPAGTVARSYIEEALRAFNAGCHKAVAVLMGAAAEAIVLELRDTLVAQLNGVSKSVPPQLNDSRIKTVRDAIEREVLTRKTSLDKKFVERFETGWALSDQLRMTRNDAGHPKSIEPVTHDDVHASLLIFPGFSRLVAELRTWAPKGIV